jgi:hypothetical protein
MILIKENITRDKETAASRLHFAVNGRDLAELYFPLLLSVILF